MRSASKCASYLGGLDALQGGTRRFGSRPPDRQVALSETREEVSHLDYSIDKANVWLGEIAKEFGTDDRRLVYRVLRAWLHALRDRLPSTVAAHFAAQLPELLRGVFYEGWNPSRVPIKYDQAEYVRSFARDANVHDSEVSQASSLVARVARRHMTEGVLEEVLHALPADMRQIAA
jgi:uncharacterized protein (DUF2267 family)